MVKRIWNDPVWSKVIAGVFLALGAVVASYFLNWWPKINVAVAGLANSLGSKIETPAWALLLLAVAALPALVLLAAVIWNFLGPKASSEPEWRSYTEDTYFGLRWRWAYSSNGQIKDIASFCPVCDFQVYPDNVGAYVAIPRIGLHCAHCNRDIVAMDEHYDSVESKIMRFIQQKLRAGDFNNRVES